jgi:hypothetical protein
MAKYNSYKDFEDDVINTLKHQLRPSLGERVIGAVVVGIAGMFGGVAGAAFGSYINSSVDLNEQMYRIYLEEHYKVDYEKCNRDEEKLSKLKTNALTNIIDVIRKKKNKE